jgi:hypothetical protein
MLASSGVESSAPFQAVSASQKNGVPSANAAGAKPVNATTMRILA